MSLFERMNELYPECSRQLVMQYRMGRDIMGWTNQFVYNNTLDAPTQILDQLVASLDKGVMFIDTSSSNMQE